MSGAAAVRDALARAVATLEEHEAELGRLDAALGDGDHGSGVLRGFRAAQAAADSAAGSAGELLVAAGAALADAAGGASGAVYGMLLQGAGTALGTGGACDDARPASAALRAGLTLVERLGKAEVGDKTLLDVLHPFVESLEQEAGAGRELADAWRAALPAARKGCEATVDMVARKGRAAKLGERSRGHPDPGATSLLYVLTAVGEALGSEA